MNDKDFDKIFGDRLREERQFKEDETEWTRLAARLEGVRDGDSVAISSKSNGWRRWILPLVALLLLLTTGFLFGKLNHLDKTNAALIEQMQTFKTQLNTALNTPLNTRIDTVFITKIDTVFINNNATNKANKTTYLQSKTKGLNALTKPNFELDNSNKNELINANNSALIKPKPSIISNAEELNNSELIKPNNSTLIKPNSNIVYNSKALINANKNELINKINELEIKLQVSDNQQLAMQSDLTILKEKINKTPLPNALNSIELINELTDKLINKTTYKIDSLNLIIANKDTLIAQLNNALNTQLNKALNAQSNGALNAELMTKKTSDSTKLTTELKEKGPLSINDKNTIKITKKPLTSRLFIGVNGGMIHYKTSWKTAQNIDVFKNEKSYQIGLKAEYALTDRLRLTASADYCPFEFQIFWQDARYNLPTPMHYYPPTDKIKSSKAVQQLAQAAIGAKYLFTDGKNRWRPYVGGAYTTMQILPFDTEYEVQNLANGSVRTLKEASTGVNIANLLRLDGGLEYRFSRRFVAQGEAFYNVDMNRPKKTYDLFGFRGAFLVNF